MALRNVRVPLYDGCKEDKKRELIVNEAYNSGLIPEERRIVLTVKEEDKEITVSCYWDDLRRAWEAVKRKW